MRIRLPLGRSLFFVLALLFAAVALLPLRLALDWLELEGKGFAAREAQGSVWLGALSEAQVGSIPLGNLQAQLRSLPLLAGRARVDLTRRDSADPFEGSITVSRHGFGIDDVKAKLALGAMLAPLPLASLDLERVSIHFADGLCTRAEGRASVALAGEIAGLALPGGLSGTARCERGVALLPLASGSGMEMLALRIHPDGRYTAELSVRPGDPALAQKLAAAGFAGGPGGAAILRLEGQM